MHYVVSRATNRSLSNHDKIVKALSPVGNGQYPEFTTVSNPILHLLTFQMPTLWVGIFECY